ncbi:MAG: flavin reductase family protein [Actinomycetota bacterium]|nr:flavin reductase family protein [Actinomycetota bacterium]
MSDMPTAADIERIEEFKKVFRRHPAGVAVITARRPDGKPVGFTATSVSSLAAVPPLVSFNMARVSTAWPAIEGTEHVLVHMLGVDDKELAVKMAGPADERFAGNHWEAGPHELPLLKGVPAWMVGRIVERVPVANNAVVVLEVEVGALGEYDEGLIYAERRYHRLGPEL